MLQTELQNTLFVEFCRYFLRKKIYLAHSINAKNCVDLREVPARFYLSSISFFMNQDIRWQQRFHNYEQAFLRLQEAVEMQSLNELERNGLIQRFEFTLDLAWKTLKDFLEERGFAFKPSPKDTVRLAQQSGYITYAQDLIDGLDIRNALSHDYSGEKFEQAEPILRNNVFPALRKLYTFFAEQIQETSKKP